MRFVLLGFVMTRAYSLVFVTRPDWPDKLSTSSTTRAERAGSVARTDGFFPAYHASCSSSRVYNSDAEGPKAKLTVLT